MALTEIGYVSDESGASLVVSVGRSQYGYESEFDYGATKVLLDVRGLHCGVGLDLTVSQAEHLLRVLNEALMGIEVTHIPKRVAGYYRRR